MHHSTLCLALLSVVATSGCTLLNEPVGGALTPVDGGVDAVVDSSMDTLDAMDSSLDSTVDADAADTAVDTGPPITTETRCADGRDDDMDGLTDCADFDCAGDPSCCAAGSPVLTEDWTAADLTSAWNELPSSMPSIPRRGGGGGDRYLEAFEPDDIPRGLVADQCLPMAIGLSLTVELEPKGDTSCPTGMRCDQRAAVILAPANDVLEGRWLTDDLALVMHANGHFEITQNGSAIKSHEFEPNQRVRLELTVSPGVGSRGEPAMFATVAFQVVGGGMDFENVLVSRQFLRQAQLIADAGGCERIPGLYLGVQGQGDSVFVRDVAASTRRCVNPSQFQAPVGENVTLRYDDLNFSTFAEGGMSAPTLTSSRNVAAGPVRWDLLVSGTNADPNLENTLHVGWAVGHGRSTNWDALPWDSSVTPKVGDDIPSCIGGMVACDGLVSLREPSLVANVDGSGILSSLTAAFARELDPTPGDRDSFAIYTVANVMLSPGTPMTVPATPTLTAAQVPGEACDSLRDPALLPLESDPGYWLFFTCKKNGVADSIHAVKLRGDFSLQMDGSDPVHQVVVDSSISSYAADGVSGPEPILDRTATPFPVIRLWFVARARGAVRAVALAQAEEKPMTSFAAELPPFVEFGANPILTSDNVALGACPDECPLFGLAVTRRVDDPGVVRFLVARRVNDSVDGLVDELVPLEQFWSTL